MKNCLLYMLILILPELQAQEAISVAGGSITGSGGSVSYSVGQLFYLTPTGSNGASSEGMQHPYTISVVALETTAREIPLSVLVYPNPTTLVLNLEVGQYSSGMEYLIYDMQGKLLQHAKIKGRITSVGIAHLPPSIYILNLVKDHDLIKSFKIVKN